MIGWHCFSHDTVCSLAPSVNLFLLNLLNLDLTRFLQEWENGLYLNDCAKDSPPVWPRECDLLSLISWASITLLVNRHSGLCVPTPSVLRVWNWKYSTIILKKLFTWLLNLLHCFRVVSPFMFQSSISHWSFALDCIFTFYVRISQHKSK